MKASEVFAAAVLLYVSTAVADVQVNTYIPGDQSFPRVATRGDQGFAITWASGWQDGSYDGVYARLYDASGTARTGEFQVNVETYRSQRAADVGMDAEGRLTVVWQSLDADSEGIWGRRYGADGTPLGGEFQINTYQTSRQLAPKLGVTDTGAFMVAWESNRLFPPQDHTAEWMISARAYDASGLPGGAETVVNLLAQGEKPTPMPQPDGSWRVGYRRYGDIYHLPLTSTAQIQSLSASGDPLGDPVDLLTTGGAVYAADGAGNILLLFDQDNNGTDSYDVYAQWYDPAFQPKGPAYRVNTFSAGSQFISAAAVNRQGQSLLAWRSQHEGQGWDAYAQAYDVDGTPLGGEFRLNEWMAGDQMLTDLALNDDGRFGAVWFASDGDGYGVFARFGQIPEPSTAALLALSGLRLFRWRRRDARRDGGVLR